MKKLPLQERMRAFVAANTSKSGVRCRTCVLPEEVMRAVRDEHATGGRFTVLSKFLQAEGFAVTPNMLSFHFREHEPKR